MKRYTETIDLDFYANKKEEIDKYACANCISFGNAILLCMGKNGGCTEFSIKDENRYNLNYIENNKTAYRIFSYDEIKEALSNQHIKITLTTIDIEKDPEEE